MKSVYAFAEEGLHDTLPPDGDDCTVIVPESLQITYVDLVNSPV